MIFVAFALSNCQKDSEKTADTSNQVALSSGNTTPTPSQGKVGDYYFDKSSRKLYGPKTSEGWGTPKTLSGQYNDNTKILLGNSAPAKQEGKLGDWYIDTQNQQLYGPKTADGWGSPTLLGEGKRPNPNPSSKYVLSRDGKTLLEWNDTEATSVNMQSDEALSKITTIGSGAFQSNPKLTSVILPQGLITIEENAFRECSQLRNVIFPNSVKNIGDYSFANCQLTEITLPKGLTSIEHMTFAENQITTITIPESVKSIGYKAFSNNQLCSFLCNSFTNGSNP